MSKETTQCHFKCYMIYTLNLMLFALFLTISFDVATGNYMDVLQPNGRCVSVDIRKYGTFIVAIIFLNINKIAQLVLFITYLYYTYKLSKDISDAGTFNNQQSLLHKLAVAMGAFIGLANSLFMLAVILNVNITMVTPFLTAIFLLQQCVVVTIFLCSKKVHRLYGECLSKD